MTTAEQQLDSKWSAGYRRQCVIGHGGPELMRPMGADLSGAVGAGLRRWRSMARHSEASELGGRHLQLDHDRGRHLTPTRSTMAFLRSGEEATVTDTFTLPDHRRRRRHLDRDGDDHHRRTRPTVAFRATSGQRGRSPGRGRRSEGSGAAGSRPGRTRRHLSRLTTGTSTSPIGSDALASVTSTASTSPAAGLSPRRKAR